METEPDTRVVDYNAEPKNPLPAFSLHDPEILRQLAKPGCRKCAGRGHTGMILQISAYGGLPAEDAKSREAGYKDGFKKLVKPVPNQCACVRKALSGKIAFNTENGKITVSAS